MKTRGVNIRLPPHVDLVLVRLAEQTHHSKSEVARQAILIAEMIARSSETFCVDTAKRMLGVISESVD